MAKDEYGIYRKPAATSIVACLGVAAALFFGGTCVNLWGKLSDVSEINAALKSDNAELKSQVATFKAQLARGRYQDPGYSEPVYNPVYPRGVSVSEPGQSVGNVAGQRRVDSAGAGHTAVKPVPTQPQPSQGRLVAPFSEAPVKEEVADKSPRSDAVEVVDGTVSSGGTAGNSGDTFPEASGLNAMVTAYQAETGKVSINIGSASDPKLQSVLRPGRRLSVWRDGKYVTDLRVQQVYSVTSTCEVAGPTQIGVRDGDQVKLASTASGVSQ